jgi:predicted enzyme related to lactoylglutathione lyase
MQRCGERLEWPVSWRRDVSTSIVNVTFDCSNAASMARFWSEVITWPSSTEEMPGNPYWVVGPPEEGGTRLVFVDVPEAKAVKNRVHLDLMPRDRSQEEEVARIESLGGRLIDDRRQASPGGWVVMADPEGNEFCVEGGE